MDLCRLTTSPLEQFSGPFNFFTGGKSYFPKLTGGKVLIRREVIERDDASKPRVRACLGRLRVEWVRR